jgi:hypothetical protein
MHIDFYHTSTGQVWFSVLFTFYWRRGCWRWMGSPRTCQRWTGCTRSPWPLIPNCSCCPPHIRIVSIENLDIPSFLGFKQKLIGALYFFVEAWSNRECLFTWWTIYSCLMLMVQSKTCLTLTSGTKGSSRVQWYKASSSKFTNEHELEALTSSNVSKVISIYSLLLSLTHYSKFNPFVQ